MRERGEEMVRWCEWGQRIAKIFSRTHSLAGVQKGAIDAREESPLGPDEDPFETPVVLEIRDVFDLHSIPPAAVKAVVEEYLREASLQGFSDVRIIHGKGVGVQRAIVRSILARSASVLAYRDAPPTAGGLGATLVTLRTGGESSVHQIEWPQP
jgi:hypothetical protein